MIMKTKSYLLDSNLKIISVIYTEIQPKSSSVTIRDDSMSSLSLKLEITNSIYLKNNDMLDYTQYVYNDEKFYKILKIVKYKTYTRLDVYECQNVQNDELQNMETPDGVSYMLEVK